MIILTKEQEVDRKFKSMIFLGAYFIYFATLMISSVYAGEEIEIQNTFADRLGWAGRNLLWAVIVGLNLSIYSCKIYYHKAVKVFILGFSLYILWGIFVTVSGLNVFHSYEDLFQIARHFLRTFLTVNLVLIYRQNKLFLRVMLLCMATLFLFMFIRHFNGFAFFNSLRSISTFLSGKERDRYAYGLGHPNNVSLHCLYYLVMTAIYKATLEETSKGSVYKDAFLIYFLLVSPLVVIITLNTASRSGITGLILCMLVYWIQTVYQNISIYIKVMFVMLIALIMISIIFLVDWQKVYTLSSRAYNYIVWLSYMGSKNAWLTGIGFLSWGGFRKSVSFSVLDGSYLIVLLQSGVVGFIFLISAIAYMTFLFFQGNATMTKSQKIIGGLLASVLYIEIFQSTFLIGGFISEEIWALIIIGLNERLYQEKSNSSFNVTKSRLKAEKSIA